MLQYQYMVKNYRFLLLLFCLISTLQLSNAQVLILSNSNFAGSSFAGPINTSVSAGAASRYAYIFPASVVNTLVHGDTIGSISFLRNGGGGSISGNCNMKIYMRMTSASDYGAGSINWVNQTTVTGMKKVYDTIPTAEIGSIDGWVRFIFKTPYVVDTLTGKNLEILVEYSQTSAQQTNIFWSFENSGSITGYSANQTKFVRTNGNAIPDTTNNSTEWHPSIRIEFPRNDFDINVKKLYSLGKLPVPIGNPDSVRAIIQNVGKKAATFTMYLQSHGANNLIDSATYSLNYLEEKMIIMPMLYPTAIGMDTLTAIVQHDSDVSNNRISVLRLANSNVYSYKDPTRPIAGGIGFNGGTGDFVAKFYSNIPKAINQISVSFAGSNQPFQLGIWKTDGKDGIPGTLVWLSDTLKSSPNFITPVLPAVTVDSNFYVGVRQLGTINVAFGYQPELPVRPNTFYYFSSADTTWVDFSPGAPFKFAIEPRLQVINDLAPIEVITPKDTVLLNNLSTIAPQATIVNYGSADQLTPFSVKLNIFRFGILQYTSTRTDTLSSGRLRKIQFDSSFLPTFAGDYDIHVITRLVGDQMIDNDTLRTKFIVAVFNDVGPTAVFDPSSSFDYEQFIDTIFPTFIVQNYGIDFQGPFSVRAEIYDSAMNLIYFDSKSFSLSSLNSILASFKPFPCSNKGTYYFRAFTQLANDADRKSDTVRRTFRIVRSNDVAITSIIYPANNSSLPPPVSTRRPEAILENFGDLNQADPFWNYCEIYYNDSLIYRDSIDINSFRTIPQTLLFKNFTPTSKGYYRMLVYSSLDLDPIKSNDTAVSIFAVGIPDDVEIISIQPTINSSLELKEIYPTSVTVRNNGYNPQNNPFALIFKVSQGQNIQYLKVKMISLDSGETKTFVIDTSLFLENPADYDVLVYTSLAVDFLEYNDTFTGIYNGVKSYDIGVESILYPRLTDTLLVNIQNVETQIRIVNYGDSISDGTFRATLQVLSKSNKVVLFTKNIDTSMNGADTLLLTFSSFSLSNPLDVLLRASTTWIDDQYKANDSAFSESRFMLLYDASANAILLPSANAVYLKTAADFIPQVQIKNNGIKQLESVFVRLVIVEVDSVTFQETVVYRDSLLSENVSVSELRTINFLQALSPGSLNKGRYKARLFLNTFSDQFPQNNTNEIQFRIDEKTDIHSLLLSAFKAYPIPVSDKLILEFEGGVKLPVEVLIMDAQGKIVLRTIVNELINSIDLSDLAAGMYTVQCGNGLIKIIVD